MRYQEQGGLHEDLLNLKWTTPGNILAAITNFAGATLTIAELEARKLHHDSTELITRAVQPALWLLIFGEVLARTSYTHWKSLLHRFHDARHLGSERLVYRNILRHSGDLGEGFGDFAQAAG